MKFSHFHIFCILFLSLVFVAACSDDESFSVSRSHLLTFSEDTIRMDTVFSRVPTPTQSFWVYNRSGDGIRCSSVKLAKGNQTGFRVNVDGVYLGSSRGYQVQNVEIRNKDSIRVFVELTSPDNGADGPMLLEDDLVFMLESGVEQKVNLCAYTWDAELLSDVVIMGDSTLGGEKPTVIYGPLRVDSGATLHIPAGKTLYFHAGAGIEVYGRLLVEGTADANVTLRGDRTDNMFDYLPYDLVSGQWNGIHFHESSYENVINFTDLHSTFNGIVCDSSDVERMKLDILNTIIHNCQGAGLQAANCKLSIVNCQLTNTLGCCLDINGGNVLLQHCTLAQYYPFDANRGAALQFTNNTGHPLLFSCLNSLVTGYADDCVMGIQNDTLVTFDYVFINDILRTPEVKDTLRFKNVQWENVEDTAAVQGMKHFRLVSGDTQHYDFHLDSLSTAIGAANPLYSLPYDRDGRQRDETPDIGCYEFYPVENKQSK